MPEQRFSALNSFVGKYEINFQLWGKGNYNIYISKDDVELWSSGGHETADEAMTEALRYLRRINKVKG